MKKNLINAQELKKIVDNELKEVKIFEVGWEKQVDSYQEKHIPGSYFIDSNEFEQSPTWTTKPNLEISDFLRNNGINSDTAIILYSKNDYAASSFKTGLLLIDLGVENVKILDGGFDRWETENYPIEKGTNEKKSAITTDINVFARKGLIRNLEDTKYMLEHENEYQVIDIRGWQQYKGADTGYTYVKKSGRIPKTVYGASCSLSYTADDGTMKNITDVLEMFTKLNIDINKHLSFFCGSASWGAAMVVIYALESGYTNVSIFEGGWNEWQLADENPIETEILDDALEPKIQ